MGNGMGKTKSLDVGAIKMEVKSTADTAPEAPTD